MKSWLLTGLSRSKPVLRWGLLAAACLFLGKTLLTYWTEVTQLRLREDGLAWLAIASGVTLLAHIWSGWVWGTILQSLQQPVSPFWSTCVYLRTNLWKYLPGNVWHFWGRLRALQSRSVPTGVAVAGVVIDPLLMAIAALILGLINITQYWLLQIAGLTILLLIVHPRFLNPVILKLGRSKVESTETIHGARLVGLRNYPLKPLLGEIGFVILRGLGFLCVMIALMPMSKLNGLHILSNFSFAWCLGLVVPGAPGGVGIFEVTAMSLLRGNVPMAVILGTVALYRFIGILTEVIGYGLATLAPRMYSSSS